MKGNFKYKLEENKDKLFIWAGIGLVGVVAAGAFFMFSNKKENIYDETKLANAVLADQLLIANSKGDLELIQVKDSKSLSTLDISENSIVAKAPNIDGAFVYDKDSGEVFKVVSKNDKLSKEKIFNVKENSRISLSEYFKTNGKEFVFVAKDNIEVYSAEGKQLFDIEDKWINPDSVEITDDGLYLTKGERMALRVFDEDKTKSINLGDRTVKIQESGDQVLALNQFGSGLGNRMIVRVDDGKLKIHELKKIESLSAMMLESPADSDIVSMLDYGDNKDAEPLLTTMDAIAVDKKGQPLEKSSPYTIKISTIGTFSPETSKMVKGYLYNADAEEGSVSITQTKNGREAKRVSTDLAKTELFYVPIYK